MKKTKEQTIELKYKGCLEGASSVYLHYGIGENWNDITECKMRKLKSGYKAEVTVPTDEPIKFCFRDASGNWDNNYGFDYKYGPDYNEEYKFVDVNPTVVSTTKTTKKTK